MTPLGRAVALPIALWASAIAFSRFYLGVHFPSDIAVGVLIGAIVGAGFLMVG